MLFGGPEARAGAGHVVIFVLVFNSAAGFVYVLAGAGTLLGRRWALGLARLLAGSTLVVFVALDLYAVTGGEVEARTLLAMTLRALFWVGQALVLRRLLARPAPG